MTALVFHCLFCHFTYLGGPPVELERVCSVVGIEIGMNDWDLRKLLTVRLEELKKERSLENDSQQEGNANDPSIDMFAEFTMEEEDGNDDDDEG